MAVRFDDRIATITAQDADDPLARAAMWRQLVDILAQTNVCDLSPLTRDSAYVFLEQERHIVSPTERRSIATALSGRHLPLDMVRFFAADRPEVAAPLIMTVRLNPVEWQQLVATVGPVTRSLIRQRRDLDPLVHRQIDHFGPSDLMLQDGRANDGALDLGGLEMPIVEEVTSPEIEVVPADSNNTPLEVHTSFVSAPRSVQIRDLVDRIERFRQQRQATPFVPVSMVSEDGPELYDQSAEDLLRQFRFEVDHEGIMHWVDAPDRIPLIGLSFAEAAPLMGYGVDGHVVGAFVRRSAFRDGRLLVSGRSRVSGSWCVSGVPLFDEASGRFRGYRGTARRPYPHERPVGSHFARTSDLGLESTVPSAIDDAAQMQRLRELVHELRTPINAISGFGDMIRSQFLGPVPRPYRERADGIVRSASELTQILDDLSMLVRNPGQPIDKAAETGAEDGGIDGGEVLRRVLEGHRPQAEARHVELQVEVSRTLPPLAVGPQVLERVMSRLLGNVVELCDAGEQIGVDFMSLTNTEGCACLSIARPGKLIGIHADELFDPDRAGEGTAVDGPRLALGFTLHLLRNVARQFGGDLDIADHDFLLLVPTLTPDHLVRLS